MIWALRIAAVVSLVGLNFLAGSGTPSLAFAVAWGPNGLFLWLYMRGNLHLPRQELKHAFVLKPLVDIAADTRHPVHGKTLGELWAAFPKDREPLYPDDL